VIRVWRSRLARLVVLAVVLGSCMPPDEPVLAPEPEPTVAPEVRIDLRLDRWR
jgi:hypothetical protein